MLSVGTAARAAGETLTHASMDASEEAHTRTEMLERCSKKTQKTVFTDDVQPHTATTVAVAHAHADTYTGTGTGARPPRHTDWHRT